VSPPGAGYSGTPLPRKLGIKPGARLAVIKAPHGFDETLGELPSGVVARRRAQGTGFDVIVAFCKRRAEVERGLRGWRTALRRLRDQLESGEAAPAPVSVAGGNPHATGIP